MYLNRFGVKNYKCLGDIDIPLTPIHVLIGENDSGKTSLLEAMLINSDETHLKSITSPLDFRELVNHHASSEAIDFEGQWQSREADAGNRLVKLGFRLEYSEGYEGHYFKSKEWVYRDACKIVKDTETGKIVNETDPAILFSQEEISSEYIKYVKYVQPRKYAVKYNFNPRVMAAPSVSNPNRLFRMDPDGFGLPNLLDNILGNNPERFIALRKNFCEYFPQFTSIRIEPAEGKRLQYNERESVLVTKDETGKGVYFDARSGRTVRAEQASDGAILFLGFLALAYLPTPPNLLLIEEPENGIYPKKLEQLVMLLKNLVERTEGVRFPQIIMTTHSPYLLSYFEPEEVTFLSRPKNDPSGPVRARPLRDAPYIEERLAGGQFYLGELWYNLSEGELFGDMEIE